MSDIEEQDSLNRALSDIDARVHASLGPDAVLQSALDGFVEALGTDAGDIKILEAGEWVVRYQRGFSTDEVGVRLSVAEAPVAAEVARTGKPRVIADYLAQDAVPYAGFPLRHHLRSTIAVPLFARGEVMGCLFAWMRDEPREFSATELDFALRMATSVALALENARLYQAEQRARQRAERAEQRLGQELGRTRILLKASDELTRTIEIDELLERLASVLLEATGLERVFINLIDVPSRVLIPKYATGGLVMPQGKRIPFGELSQTSLAAIVAGRTTLLDYESPQVPAHDREIADANQAKLVLFVPLIHHDEVIGHISLDQPGVRHEFSSEQTRIVESIAAQATVAIQNARRFEREHRIADVLQQALLATPDTIEGLDVSLLYQPASNAANVGGDFYDVFEMDDDHVALLVGDVAGKGIRAAQLTSLVRDGARAYLLEDPEPASCMGRLNDFVYRFTPTEKFATVFLGVLELSTGRLSCCSAAHPPAVVVGDDEVRMLGSNRSFLLGAFLGSEFERCETTLAPGERLVVVTDGVTEARRDNRLFGEQGLADTLRDLRDVPVARIPEEILAHVKEYSSAGLRDDVVILCVSPTGEAR